MIIAEAGVNHNGRLDLAYRLVDAAVWAGADYVKFQTFITEDCISKDAPKAAYQGKGSQFEMVKGLELSFDDFEKIKEYCEGRIGFLSSPFDLKSVEFLSDLKMIKIASGEITNLPLLRKIRKPVLLSTGMSTLEEIGQAIMVLRKNRVKITLLHCVSAYPCPLCDANLKAIETLKRFSYPVGYSDHTLGIEAVLAATALGATVIEKHLTLDRNMDGCDHKISLEPKEFKEMVEKIHNIEIALGDGVKKPQKSEIENLIVRKSIVASRDIRKGEVFTEENLTTRRPGIGISPMKWDKVLGLAAQRDYKNGERI